MKLSEIETADLPVREMTITDSQITILYDEVYHIPTQSYIKNIQITIRKGISKENQYWMEYYITEGQWVLL